MSEIIKPAHINIMWRMHQPPFKDPGSGTYALPFTRLHALKDYGPMLRYIEKRPNMRATFNFTPALLVQIEDYSRGASEIAQRISLKKVEDLTADEKRYILASFLPATLRKVIEETPRYKELREKRETEAAALTGQEVPAEKKYTNQDYMDLQVWFNLAMFSPITVEEDKEIKDLYQKGKNFRKATRR